MAEIPDYFVHEKGLCESRDIGVGTRVWAFAHVLAGAKVGSECNICDHVFIENDVVIGDRVTIKCGVQVWDGVTLGDDVFVGPNVTFTNDLFPRSKVYPTSFERTIIRNGASLGANSTILPGITIGAGAMIGAGSVVTKSVPARAIVMGNPGKITGYVDTKKPVGGVLKESLQQRTEAQVCSVKGVKLIKLNEAVDIRGSLSVGEFERSIPFKVQRFFLVYGVPTAETRGEHAHLQCHQFLVAAKGSVRVVADDGQHREEFILDSPSAGVYLPPMTWGIQYQYTPDAVLLVFASDYYDSQDYIRDYEQFIGMVG